ncbi:MAG: type II secretion system protein GspE [Spirochaetae bacterium HGW-Spirochaetae-1]|jgi:general secretion pathway protein E|nr:MAG: type II secretion system protein GspE [Spirochaetae bacterium HGW-Spirochaetae-1]
MAKTKHFGKILVEQNIITPEQLQEALLLQKNSSLRLGELLIKKGVCSQEQILKALGDHYGIDTQLHIEFDDPDNLFGNIPTHFLNKNRIVPFKKKGQYIHVALVDALNVQPLDDLKMLFPKFEFRTVLTIGDEIQRLIHTHYDVLKDETTHDVIEDLEESDFEILSSQISETEDISDMANDAPIIRLVNTIIKQAVNERASDIHIEPFEKDLIVRFRIDGILYQQFTPPKKYQGAVISRIKIMANLNIAENRLPQDGRIQLKISGKDIDIRVSIFPTHYGERVVLRLLNKTDMKFDLDSLGFSKRDLDVFNELIKKSHGVILVTGPTGSGKSTTLYSVLVRLNTHDVNILTVEDPIEYQLHGIGQMQVKPKIELTFSTGLRSILRQDPDIIMIGEIRDLETAEIAVQSALTGHQVFSTLHTNDAASGITRLLDMGIEPFLIASSVNAFLAQRLIRRICPHCKESYKPTPKVLSELNLKPSQLKQGKFYAGKGCDKCLNTGYSGRTGIYELLPVTTEIRRLIIKQTDSEEIKNLAISQGMQTLREDGLNKVIEGITSVEEVLRVT